MADPRFFINRGPLRFGDACARLGLNLPAGANKDALLADVATLDAADSDHVVFCIGKAAAAQLSRSGASVAIVEPNFSIPVPDKMVLLRAVSPIATFAAIAEMLYPEHARLQWDSELVSPSAKIGQDVEIAPGAVIGPRAEIGDRTRIGPHAVIGPGVLVGRDCDIGAQVTVTHSYLGDFVSVFPGAQIGQSGFGFASDASGHTKIPQLGRVIIQDRVEIGACTTIDRGALADTVIGEGTKIDNLVQIGHNCRIGRHCIIVAQVGMSGSCELGDFVVLGGQVGLADHSKIGDRARLAARSAMAPGELPGGQDYGGAPAIPVREWRRQMAAYAMLGRRRKQNANG